jgi:hypothetical protein
MNWDGVTSLDQFWRSPAFPMWLILVAAGFFGIIVLVTLLRAEKSVANGALTMIALLTTGIAVASTIHGFGSGAQSDPAGPQSPRQSVALPALSCIDDLAGEAVLTACEKALFGSPESAAAAVSYAASQIARLTALGDVAAANPFMSPELQALRRAVERDRYGVMAQALLARDRCTPSECPVFRALTDSRQIVSNMSARVYDGLIARYAPTWNAPAAGAVAALAPSVPTGKPTNADFPTSNSIPPVSIMNPEPGTPPSSRPPAVASTPVPSPRPTSTASVAPVAAKKPPAPKPAPLQPPPGTPAPTPALAPTPAAANE